MIGSGGGTGSRTAAMSRSGQQSTTETCRSCSSLAAILLSSSRIEAMEATLSLSSVQ